MVPKRIVVIGGSSGALDPVKGLAAELPPGFPAAVCVVLHTAPDSPGMLAPIIGRASRLPALQATDGTRLRNGHIYVAPPDHHLLVEPGTLRLTRGPKENRFRPAIDPLFRSAAQVYGPAAVGVILSGNLDDGTAGLWAIKRLGGVAIVQDPGDAEFPSMPASAATHVEIDYSVSRRELASVLLATTAPPGRRRAQDRCPRIPGGGGDAFAADSLLAAIHVGIDEALWNAVRTLEEASLLLDALGAHQAAHGTPAGARARASHGLAERADEIRRQAEVVRDVVLSRTTLTRAG